MIIDGRPSRAGRRGSGLLPRRAILAGGILVAASALIVSSGPAGAATGPTLPPFELSAYRFVVGSEDATGAFLNPAGLARAKGTNLYLDVSGDGTEILEGTAALQGGSWAFTYRHRDLSHRDPVSPVGLPAPGEGNADTYLFAAGFGPPRYRLGISRAWTNVDLPGEDAGTWNVAFLSRPSPRLCAGILVENIQHPRFLDGRLVPRYTYALSVGLLPSRPDFLVFTGQGSHLDGSPDRIDVSGGLRARFSTGLDVGLVVRHPFGGDVEVGGSISRSFGRGAVAARARSVSQTDRLRGQVALQMFDQFWQRSHGGGTQPPSLPGRRPPPRRP